MMLHPDNEDWNIALTTSWDNFDSFIDALELAVTSRYLVPCDIYLIYDDKETYKNTIRAWKMKLPVILHVRDAHEDALRILRWHPARKLGGVIHCFYGSKEIAEQYLKLGYHFGIGGSVLQLEERAKDLWEAIPSIPLDRILLETDAPFILHYCKDAIQPKLLRRVRNTSLILQAVIKKIADLKNISPTEVELATAENAIRLFHLPIDL